jgi:hypothetical protein
MTVLLAAMASAMVIASRAVPEGSSPIEAVSRAGPILQQMTSELRTAVKINSCSLTAIEFVVPDRDGDLADDTMAYAWSGTDGDPLTRQVNGGNVTSFVENVHDFSLTYDLTSASQEVPGDLVESGRQQLASCVTGPDLTQANVSLDSWWGQCFEPTLPADAEAWNISEVQVRARQAGTPDGVTSVQLRHPKLDRTPEATPLESVDVVESNLPEPGDLFTWWLVAFSSARNFSPDEGMCLVLVTDDKDSWELEYYPGGVITPDSGMIWSGAGEGGWTAMAGASLRYLVYGTVVTRGSPQTVDVYYLLGTRIVLQVGSNVSAWVDTEVEVLNMPVVAAP